MHAHNELTVLLLGKGVCVRVCACVPDDADAHLH